jgi:hypothetical protein
MGILFIMTQQVQPACIIEHIASQHDWIIAQQSLSPDVQVKRTPSLVISHLHMPIVRLQQQTTMPFIMQQQLHIEPAMLVQRLWITPQAIMSVQLQTIFIPPVHFSIFTVQRGTIMVFIPGMAAGIIGVMPAGILPNSFEPVFELFISCDLLWYILLPTASRQADASTLADRRYLAFSTTLEKSPSTLPRNSVGARLGFVNGIYYGLRN